MKEISNYWLSQKKWPSVVLLIGTRYSNKQDLALQAIRQLLCQHTQEENCVSCDITTFNHPDVFQVVSSEDESVISLDTIKQGVKHMYTSPLLAAKKILYIQSADLLSTEAANALLKPMEETQENRYFLLLASSADRVLPTIRSRSIILNCLTQSPSSTASSLPLGVDLSALPKSIIEQSSSRFQLIERLHSELAKLPQTQIRQLLTEETTKWQTIFLQEHRNTQDQQKRQRLRTLAKQCEQIPQFTQQHVSIRSIFETMISTV